MVCVTLCMCGCDTVSCVVLCLCSVVFLSCLKQSATQWKRNSLRGNVDLFNLFFYVVEPSGSAADTRCLPALPGPFIEYGQDRTIFILGPLLLGTPPCSFGESLDCFMNAAS